MSVGFDGLLARLLLSEDSVREEAEQTLEAIANDDFERWCLGLAVVLAEQQPGGKAVCSEIRCRASILLRQSLTLAWLDSPALPLASGVRDAIRAHLLTAVRGDPPRPLMLLLAETIASLAVPKCEWPELSETLSWLLEEGGPPLRREGALKVLKEILVSEPVVANRLLNQLRAESVLKVCLVDGSSPVRKEAVHLFLAILQHLPPSAWHDLKPQLAQVVATIQYLDVDAVVLHECIDALVEAIEMAPTAINQETFAEAAKLAFSICRAPFAPPGPLDIAAQGIRDAQDSFRIRHSAFAVLASLCENCPHICLAHSGFVHELIELCMQYMLQSNVLQCEDAGVILAAVQGLDEADDPASNAGIFDKAESFGCIHISAHDIGEESLDRIIKALGVGFVSDNIVACIQDFALHTSWKYRYVALLTLSQLAECLDENECSHAVEISRLLAELLLDSHQRVRFAALHVIGQLATDKSPCKQNEFRALVKLLDDSEAHVVLLASTVVMNYMEGLDLEELLPFVPDLLHRLLSKFSIHQKELPATAGAKPSENGERVENQSVPMLLPSLTLAAREQFLSVIALIVDIVGVEFVHHYQSLAETLMSILKAPFRNDQRRLRSKALECFSLLGFSAGVGDVFREDSLDVMRTLLETPGCPDLQTDPSEDLQSEIFIREAVCRICRALKGDFVPFLPHLIPGLRASLRQLAHEPLVASGNDNDEDRAESCLTAQQIESGHSAVQVVCCFVNVIGPHLIDHLPALAQGLLAALSLRHHPEITQDALQGLEGLLSISRAEGAESSTNLLLRSFLGCVMEQLQSEDNPELMHIQTTGLIGAVRVAGPGALNMIEIGDLSYVCRSLIEASFLRQDAAERQAAAVSDQGKQVECGTEEEDEDEEDGAVGAAEEECVTERLLRTRYVELASTITEACKVDSCAFGLSHLFSLVQQYLSPGSRAIERELALQLAGDIVACLGDGHTVSLELLPVLAEPMLQAFSDEVLAVRHAAAYACLQVALLSSFAPFASRAAAAITTALSRLRQTLRDGSDPSPSAAPTEDIVVAALGTLCCFQAAAIGPSCGDYVDMFLATLPPSMNVYKGRPVHQALMALIQKGNLELQGQTFKVLRTLQQVYASEASIQNSLGHSNTEHSCNQAKQVLENVKSDDVLTLSSGPGIGGVVGAVATALSTCPPAACRSRSVGEVSHRRTNTRTHTRALTTCCRAW